MLYISIQRCEMCGGVHSMSRRSQNQEYICKSRRSHLNFLLNFESFFQVLALYPDNICRAEYCILEDLPKVANFCLKKNKQKSIWKPQILLSVQEEQEQMTRHSLSSLSHLHLAWGLTVVHFNSCRRWTEEACNHSSIRGLDPDFLSVQSIWKQDEPFN